MIGAILAAAVVLVVSFTLIYPIFRPPLEPVGDPPGPAARLATLEDRKAAIYGSIRDLGQDLRTDKLDDADYRREAELLKTQAVAVLAEIEELRAQVPRAPAPVEAQIAEIVDRLGSSASPGPSSESVEATFCTSCGRQAGADDRFCSSCGSALRDGS